MSLETSPSAPSIKESEVRRLGSERDAFTAGGGVGGDSFFDEREVSRRPRTMLVVEVGGDEGKGRG